MSIRYKWALTVAAAAALAIAAGSGGRQTTPARAADGVVVSMRNSVFAPVTITVSAGGSVTWVNNEDPAGVDVVHDILADDFTSWGSAYVNPGESYSYTFSAPGTYNYVCDLHPEMTGTVVVQ